MILFIIYLTIIPIAFVIILRLNVIEALQHYGSLTKEDMGYVVVVSLVMSVVWFFGITVALFNWSLNNTRQSKDVTNSVKKALRIK